MSISYYEFKKSFNNTHKEKKYNYELHIKNQTLRIKHYALNIKH